MTSMTWMYALTPINDELQCRLTELDICTNTKESTFLPSADWGEACAENIGNHLPAGESGLTLSLSIQHDDRGCKFVAAGPFVKTDRPSEMLSLATRMIRELAGDCRWVPAHHMKWEPGHGVETNQCWELTCPGSSAWKYSRERRADFLTKAPESIRPLLKSRLALYRDLKPNFFAFGRFGYEGYIAVGFSDRKMIVVDSYLHDRHALILNQTDLNTLRSYSLADLRCLQAPYRSKAQPLDRLVH